MEEVRRRVALGLRLRFGDEALRLRVLLCGLELEVFRDVVDGADVLLDAPVDNNGPDADLSRGKA